MKQISVQSLGPISLNMEMGRGGCGVVWRGYCPILNSSVVLKITKRNMFFENEFLIGRLINHPLACQCFSFQDRKGRQIGVLEYIEGQTLRDMINSNHSLKEPAARLVFIELVSIIDYLHNDLRMVHRDIKSDNIMIDQNGNAHLIDFGYIVSVTEKKPELLSFCGSPNYIPPEAITNRVLSFANDVWSLGIVLYSMVTGMLPFNGDTPEKLIRSIACDNFELPEFLSKELKQLLHNMLLKDHTMRMTIREIMNHPWLNPTIDGVKKMANFALMRKLMVMPESIEMIDHDVIEAIANEHDINPRQIEIDIMCHANNQNVALYKSERLKRLKPQLNSLVSNLIDTKNCSMYIPLPVLKNKSLPLSLTQRNQPSHRFGAKSNSPKPNLCFKR